MDENKIVNAVISTIARHRRGELGGQEYINIVDRLLSNPEVPGRAKEKIGLLVAQYAKEVTEGYGEGEIERDARHDTEPELPTSSTVNSQTKYQNLVSFARGKTNQAVRIALFWELIYGLGRVKSLIIPMLFLSALITVITNYGRITNYLSLTPQMRAFNVTLLNGPRGAFIFWFVFLLLISSYYQTILGCLALIEFGAIQKWGLAFIAYSVGARQPSEAESDAYTKALTIISQTAVSKKLPAHENMWVYDYQMPQAHTLGSDLFISSSALKTSYLPAIIAHEMGELAMGTGRVKLGLKMMTSPFGLAQLPKISTLGAGTILPPQKTGVAEGVDEFVQAESVLRVTELLRSYGGLGVQLSIRLIAPIFKELDYLADWYVADQLRLENALKDYLEHFRVIDTVDAGYKRWRGFSELRMDYLSNKNKLADMYGFDWLRR